MISLERLIEAINIKKKTVFNTVSLLSIAALVVANVAPELTTSLPSQAEENVEAQQPASPPSDSRYIYVDENSSSINGDGSIACAPFNANTPYPTTIRGCSLGEALQVAQADGDSGPLTIVIADAITTIELTEDLPFVFRPQYSRLIIDGIKTNGSTKTIIKDNTTNGNTLDYFFSITSNRLSASTDIPQDVTIKNFSFVRLKKVGSAAITTSKVGPTSAHSRPTTTSVIDSALIANLRILDNNFGTAQGLHTELNLDNTIYQGIKVFSKQWPVGLSNELIPSRSLQISRNNFYNTTLPIQLGTGNTSANCIYTDDRIVPTTYQIGENIIGTARNLQINTTFTGEGGWSVAAINICSLSNVNIHNNIISNSRGDHLDTGVLLKNSQFTLQNNIIGGGTIAHTIYGYGVTVDGRYELAEDARKYSYILGNFINNIYTLIGQTALDNCTNRYALTANGKSCGGTAVLLEGAKYNWIYNNIIGDATLPNQGYGIEIEGTISGFTSLNSSGISFNASAMNKIFSNIIGYNVGDGIHVGTIQNTTNDNSLNSSACTRETVVGTEYTNNCDNLITQNSLFRNGRYNEPNFASLISSPEGGIGIDLRSSTDTVEQKYGLTAFTGSGTTNDSDISLNINATDADVGGNEVLNFPIISGTGSTTTSSSSYEIKGTLADNANGKYWVEVYAIMCPAEGTATPTITYTNAFTNCDTDSISGSEQTARQTYGQGAFFLCGALVNKTTAANSERWSCKPSDIGITTFTSGLITATATKLPANITKVDYRTNPPSIVPPDFASRLTGRFTCEIALEFLTFTNNTCASTVNQKALVNLNGYEAMILNGLGSTSEFSQNVYISRSSMSVTKTARVCTNSSTCTGAFASSVTATPGQLVEFKIDVHNESGTTTFPTFTDTLPEGLTFESGTCQVFINNATAPGTTRPTSGRIINCNGNISGQTLAYTSGGEDDLAANNHSTIYVLARVNTNATFRNYINTAQVIALGICELSGANTCQSSATIAVQRAPVVSVRKEFVTPDSSTNTALKTLSAPTTETPVEYRITLNLEGVRREDIVNFGLEDSFPKPTGVNINYTNHNCRFTVSIDGGAASSAQPCDNERNIAAATNPVVIWQGSSIPALGTNSRATIVVTYQATLAANPLTGNQTSNVSVVNTARWNGTQGSSTDRTANATLVITPTTQPTINLTKTVSASTITSSSSSQNVTYTITLTKPAGTAITGLNWIDTFPTSPVALTYSNCQVTVTPTGSSTVPCPTTFNGSSTTLTSATAINAATTQVQFTYTATVPANAAVTSQPITNTSTLTGTVNGTTLTRTASANLSIAAAGNSNAAITKRADNNVTGTNRTAEKIYKPGDTVNYTLTLMNSGTGQANNASIRDILPQNFLTPVMDTTPAGTITGRTINITGLTIPSGTTGTTVRYHAALDSKANFDLSDFDLDTDSNPDRDQDFYLSDDSELDATISSRDNSHRRDNDMLGAPDGKFVSLGNGGEVIIDLGSKLIVDGRGNDFAILELDRVTGDVDQSTERYNVSVSQDGDTFVDVSSSESESSEEFDIKKARMTWVRYIKIEDNSTQTKAQAPGVDIDAVCLFNIGVQLPNRAELTFNGTTVSAADSVVVDVTTTFDKKPQKEKCTEAEPEVVVPPAPLPPPPLPVPPVPAPQPPALPKTGPAALGLLGLLASGIAAFRRFRR